MGRALHEDRFFFKHKDGVWAPNPPEVVENLQEKARREEDARRELDQAGALLKTAWEKGEIPDPEWRARLANFFQYLTQAGVFFTIPLFLSVILGLTALETGVRLLPLSVGLLVSALAIPKLGRARTLAGSCRSAWRSCSRSTVAFANAAASVASASSGTRSPSPACNRTAEGTVLGAGMKRDTERARLNRRTA